MAVTHSFDTPGSHSFTVPVGVTSMQVEVAGAGGGAGSGVTVTNEFGVPLALVGVYQGGSGGPGARVTATLLVVPGDVINMTIADSGKGGTLNRYNAPAGTGAGGVGSGSGGPTANSDGPNNDTSSLNGGGGGGASVLSVAGTFIRAGGGGGGGGAHRNQATFSHAESGAAGMQPAISTSSCINPGDGLAGISSPFVVTNDAYPGTGSGGGGGGGYLGSVGAGGITPGLVFGTGMPVVEFAPTGGGGGGSCTFVGDTRTLSNINSDSQGGTGGVADQNPISTWEVLPGSEPEPIHGATGWIKLTSNLAPAATPSISGGPQIGSAMNGRYSYTDVDGDVEANAQTLYKFVTSHNSIISNSGEGTAVASGLTGGVGNPAIYNLQPSDLNRYVFYCVIPAAQTGITPGLEVCSSAAGPVSANTSAPTANPVPSLGQWALIILTSIVALFGMTRIRRRIS